MQPNGAVKPHIAGEARHRFVYTLLRAVLWFPLERLMRARISRVPHLSWPAMILPNHAADIDILVIGIACRQPMYYMAAEQLVQRPAFGRMASYLVKPIIKRKGASDAKAVRDTIQRIRAGHSVCVFPEGSTTFDGVTGPIAPAIGSLLRASGAGLVTYRIQGGYFTWPRWGHSLRRGSITGEPVHVLSPDDVRAMTPDALTELIRHDLMVDAYAANAQSNIPYRGKRLAVGIGNALYMCPACRAIGTIGAEGGRFGCACGLAGIYQETGILAGAPFATIKAWTDWQRDALIARAREDPRRVVLQDNDQTLYALDGRGGKKAVASGVMTMSADVFTLGAFQIPVAQISGLDLFRRNTIMFSTANGDHFQVGSPTERSGLPYRDLYRSLIDRKD